MKTKIKPLRFASRLPCALLALVVFFMLNPWVQAATVPSLDNAADQEIWQLNQQINEKKKAIEELQRQAEVYKKTLAQKQQKISTLTNQLSQINSTIGRVSLEIESLELQIDEVNLRLESTKLKISAKEREILEQKNRMGDIIRVLDDRYENNGLVLVLATSDSLGDYMDSLQTLQNLERDLYDNLDQMNNLKIALVSDQNQLADNRSNLNTLIENLGGKKDQLQSQQEVKSTLIRSTKGEESKYQKLLAQAKAEAAQIDSDITNLEKVAREKLQRQVTKGNVLGSGETFSWPVLSQVVTSYFHDPDYPFRNVFEHPGVDIRAKQGTEVRAAKSGYVAKAKNAGMGYSYVILVHDNQISTVYGHLSKILVTDDNFVNQGQIIGYSGGTPGTAGAGPFVTGPHLHFEVRLNGIPVDPLNYLP
ncbi:MAG: peptidoglycan DD-metalloendopeptidase family protein [Candidatus Komeilibacteria bacterium]